jgi:hypothetical protein
MPILLKHALTMLAIATRTLLGSGHSVTGTQDTRGQVVIPRVTALSGWLATLPQVQDRQHTCTWLLLLLQTVRRVGLKIARVATDNAGGGNYQHMQVGVSRVIAQHTD